MARIRSIKPDFWESEDTATLPMPVALTYAGLWNYSDDEGRGRFQPGILHAKLHALRPDASPAKTKAALDVLVERRLIVLYQVEELGTLYYIPSFKRHQHPDKPQPSKYPAPPRLLPDHSPTVPLQLPDQSALGEERRGEGKGDRRGERGNPPPSGVASPTGDPGREEAEVLETAARYAAWNHPPLEKKADGIRELRALGCTHDYIRNGAQVNKPADVGFWDVVKALKAARGAPRSTRAKVPGAPALERENAAAYDKASRPAVLEERREDVQKRQDEARAKVDKILAELDPDELHGLTADVEAAAAKANIKQGPPRDLWVQSELRRRIAKDHGVEGL